MDAIRSSHQAVGRQVEQRLLQQVGVVRHRGQQWRLAPHERWRARSRPRALNGCQRRIVRQRQRRVALERVAGRRIRLLLRAESQQTFTAASWLQTKSWGLCATIEAATIEAAGSGFALNWNGAVGNLGLCCFRRISFSWSLRGVVALSGATPAAARPGASRGALPRARPALAQAPGLRAPAWAARAAACWQLGP